MTKTPGGPTGDGTSRFTTGSIRALAPYAGMALPLGISVLLAGDELAHHLHAIDAWIASLGPWSVLTFVAVFVVTSSLFMPETLLSVMAGALFGVAEGLAAAVAAGLMAAAVQYLLARRLFRARVEKTLCAKPQLAAVQRAVAHNELKLQLLIRLTPLNPATLNYLLGATGVRFSGFLLASLAFLPHQAVEVYFGYAGRNMAAVADAVTKLAPAPPSADPPPRPCTSSPPSSSPATG